MLAGELDDNEHLFPFGSMLCCSIMVLMIMALSTASCAHAARAGAATPSSPCDAEPGPMLCFSYHELGCNTC
jgi:hypothetical protein